MARTLAQSQARGVLENGARTFWLKDYLGPNGRYAYDDLPGDLDACFRAGENVYVLDVPRLSFVVVGYHGPGRQWEYHGRRFNNPWDALRVRGGPKRSRR